MDQAKAMTDGQAVRVGDNYLVSRSTKSYAELTGLTKHVKGNPDIINESIRYGIMRDIKKRGYNPAGAGRAFANTMDAILSAIPGVRKDSYLGETFKQAWDEIGTITTVDMGNGQISWSIASTEKTGQPEIAGFVTMDEIGKAGRFMTGDLTPKQRATHERNVAKWMETASSKEISDYKARLQSQIRGVVEPGLGN
jgi:hypothetical protein